MSEFSFEITAKDKDSKARMGVIKTAHGNIETPYIIPVATKGQIIALKPKDLEMLRIQCLFANTYHLHLNPGDKIIKKFGGLHKFMKFNKPIFTDSGGFQAFSLGFGRVDNIRKIGFFPNKRSLQNNKKEEKYAIITEKGVMFKSVYDKKEHFIDAKKSMAIQSNLGSDIIMAFDECTSPYSNKAYNKKAMERTHRWALESLKYKDKKQSLYGIIQGGQYKDLRLASAKFINSLSPKLNDISP